jgi:hypothetical protein
MAHYHKQTSNRCEPEICRSPRRACYIMEFESRHSRRPKHWCVFNLHFFLQSSLMGRIRRPHTILGEASAQQHSRDFDHQQQFVAGTRRARRLVPCRHALLSLASMRCSRYLARQGPAFQSLQLVVRSYAIKCILHSHFIVRFKTGTIPPHDSKFYTVSLD